MPFQYQPSRESGHFRLPDGNTVFVATSAGKGDELGVDVSSYEDTLADASKPTLEGLTAHLVDKGYTKTDGLAYEHSYLAPGVDFDSVADHDARPADHVSGGSADDVAEGLEVAAQRAGFAQLNADQQLAELDAQDKAARAETAKSDKDAQKDNQTVTAPDSEPEAGEGEKPA